MDIEKFNSINNKMNKITKELTKNINLSEELLTTTEEMAEVIESVRSTPDDLLSKPTSTQAPSTTQEPSISVNEVASAVVDVSSMVEDFTYMRTALKETTQNSKKVLENITEELMYADDETRTALVMAFAELNKAQLEGIRLFMMTYKEISVILVNFAKVQQSNKVDAPPQYTTNVLQIEATSSADIINRLRGA